METNDLWVMLFKNSYFSKVKADLYETNQLYVVMFVIEVVLCASNFIKIGADLQLLLQNVKGLTFLGRTV